MNGDSIECVLITPKDFEAVVEFSKEYFVADEPLCKSLDLPWSPFTDYFVRYQIGQCTSVMAIDTTKGNKIVGVRVHRVVQRSDNDSDWDPPATGKSEKILQMVEFGYSQFVPFDQFTDLESFVDCKFLAVHKDYRGMNISGRMMEFTFDFMRRENVPLIYVLVTGHFSRRVMDKLDFQTVFEMTYEDYKVNGERVLFPEEPHKGFAVMLKWV